MIVINKEMLNSSVVHLSFSLYLPNMVGLLMRRGRDTVSPPHTCVPNLMMQWTKGNSGNSILRYGGLDSPNDWAAVLLIVSRSCHLEVDRATFGRHLHGDERVLEFPHLEGDIISLRRKMKPIRGPRVDPSLLCIRGNLCIPPTCRCRR